MARDKDKVSVEPLMRFPFEGVGMRPGMTFKVERERAERMANEGYVRIVDAPAVAAPPQGTYGRRDMRAAGNGR